jgi:hypothetical protein
MNQMDADWLWIWVVLEWADEYTSYLLHTVLVGI